MPINDPMASVTSGLLQGLAIANQIRRTAMEQQQMDEQRKRQDWQDQATDLRMQEMLRSGGRPVLGGGVVEQETPVAEVEVQSPDGGPSALPITPATTGTFLRKPRPEDTVKYRTRGGETIQRELYSESERQQRLMEAALLRHRMDTAAKVYEAQQMRAQVPLPGRDVPLPESVEEQRNRMAREGRIQPSVAGRDVPLPKSVEEQRNRMATEGRQPRLLSPEEEAQRVRIARSSRSPQKPKDVTPQVNQIETRILSLQREEDKLHGQKVAAGRKATALGEAWKTGNYNNIEVAVAKKKMADFQAELAGLETKIAGIQANKEKLLARKRGLYDAAGLESPGGGASGEDTEVQTEVQTRTYTETEVRERARAKGVDEEAAVAAARKKGLIGW